MSELPAAIGLWSLGGANGFRLAGAANDDRIGRSVSSAGDLNGDGFYDAIAGAWGADGNTGASYYVVFGKPAPFAPKLDLSNLAGTNGFRLDGVANDDLNGFSVSSAGAVPFDRFAAASPKGEGGLTEPVALIESASGHEMCDRASPRSEQKYGSANRAGAWKRRLYNRSLNRRCWKLNLNRD